MKYCVSCGKLLPDDSANFCPSCGAHQYPGPAVSSRSGQSPAALVTLCILTILGSVLGILKGLLVEAFQGRSFDLLNEQSMRFPFGYASALFNLGTLAGAIIMLNRKRFGYVLYLVCQSANIVAVLYWALAQGHFVDGFIGGPFYLIGAAVSVLPSLVFIVLYSLLVRKYLD